MARPTNIDGIKPFKGATTRANGEIGLVPEPRASEEGKFLRGDGTWQTPAGGGGGGAVDSVNGYTGVVVLAKSDIGLSNVNNTSDVNKPVSTATQTQLDTKAPLASPALTGSPTAPTQSPGDDSTKIATTAYVEAAVAAGGGGGGGGAVDARDIWLFS